MESALSLKLPQQMFTSFLDQTFSARAGLNFGPIMCQEGRIRCMSHLMLALLRVQVSTSPLVVAFLAQLTTFSPFEVSNRITSCACSNDERFLNHEKLSIFCIGPVLNKLQTVQWLLPKIYGHINLFHT